MAQHTVDARARLLEKRAKGAHLQQQDQSGVAHDDQRVNGPLGNYRPQSLGEGESVVALQHPTARKLADAWNHQTGSIGQKHCIHAHRSPCPRSYHRLQCLFPSPASERLCQNTEGKAEQHPRPVHLLGHHMEETTEVLTTVHPIENRPTQQDGEQYFGCICGNGFHFHGCKDSANRLKCKIKSDLISVGN